MFELSLVLTTLLAAAPDAASLPIREVTTFKDGHALVLRSGEAALNQQGDVVLTELPRPILGTFWAQADAAEARLASISVERAEAPTTRLAATIDDLLTANIGRTISFRDRHNIWRTGEILDVIESRPEPPAQPQPRSSTPPSPSRIALIREAEGVAALPLESIREARFIGDEPSREFTHPAEQERMTLDLDWRRAPASDADVSLMYIQRGLRWIPSYRITMLDEERVRVELQATLINELADLEDVTLHLAVGAPTFAFEHTPDPMALRDGLDQLGFYFQKAHGRTGGMLSNAIMAQGARMAEARVASPAAPQPAAPVFEGSERAEDLFVYTVESVSLAEGARMVLPLVSYESPVASVYTLDLPAEPPMEAIQRFNSSQQREIAEMLDRPAPRHVLRIKNENDRGYPLTTAPALVIKDGRALAQGLLTYTPEGASVDLKVGVAVDITVDTQEREINRVPNAMEWAGRDYMRIDNVVEIHMTNRKPHAVTVEVRKLALGLSDRVGQDGEATQLSIFDVDAWRGVDGGRWWRWYNWPYYWQRLNGATEFSWTVDLDPAETITLDAEWHYFWR